MSRAHAIVMKAEARRGRQRSLRSRRRERRSLRAAARVSAPKFECELIQMTMRYAHLAPEIARDAVQLLDRRSQLGERGSSVAATA
jgi:hypothetical protein